MFTRQKDTCVELSTTYLINESSCMSCIPVRYEYTFEIAKTIANDMIEKLLVYTSHADISIHFSTKRHIILF